MIRVGLSALTLVPGVVGGSEVTFRALARELPKIDDLDITVFAPSIAPDAGEGARTRIVTAYPATPSTAGRAIAMGRSLVAGGRIRQEMGLDEIDVLHFPFSTMIPTVRTVPTVSTIHDMQHEYLPEFFSRSELAYRRFLYGRTARLSDLVIAVSSHGAETLVEHLGIQLEKVRVIAPGVDLTRFKPSGEPREPFIFFPANRWPHKNHTTLFAALELLRARHPELELVLTGSGHSDLPVPKGVIVKGRVSADELVRLYQRASALVYPSLYEGFGIPLIEAMASGCPVAASNSTSIPEVCGGAAALFDPRSADDIAASIEKLLACPQPFVEAGLVRAQDFTWHACAANHADVYRELANRS
jgi:glycosyltransferase involved in cell wall biosynthesis